MSGELGISLNYNNETAKFASRIGAIKSETRGCIDIATNRNP